MQNQGNARTGTWNRIILTAAGLSLLAAAPLFAAGFRRGGGMRNTQRGGACPGLASVIADLPYEELSGEEISHITKMREEEKLAGDVYRVLYDMWKLPIFSNIARSEDRHTEAVKAIIEKYHLEDPFIEKEGVFTDPALQKLFDSLVRQGSESLAAALRVGATIEDLDIFDLQNKALPATDNEDVRTVYQTLLKGSRNHMRAFMRQLEAAGETYEAQFITPELMESILSSPRERGRYDADGVPVFVPPNRPGTGAGRGFRCGGRRGRGECPFLSPDTPDQTPEPKTLRTQRSQRRRGGRRR